MFLGSKVKDHVEFKLGQLEKSNQSRGRLHIQIR